LTGTVSSPIFSELLRGAPLLAATLNVTIPLPAPLVAPVSVIHDALLAAAQLHDDRALTAIELFVVPDAEKVTSFGVTVTLHTGSESAVASCVSFTVWFATTIDAVRVVVPGFDATAKFTVPVPVPVVPLVSTTHAASPRALHAQPLAAVTVIPPLPPEAGTVWSVEESSKRHGDAS
jgi:hypothetical protein